MPSFRGLLLLALVVVAAHGAVDDVTTLAGVSGSGGPDDGASGVGKFLNPIDVEYLSDGRIVVVDYSNHCVRIVDTNGATTTIAGLCGTAANAGGDGANARFDNPRMGGIDADDNVYIADRDNHCVRKISTTAPYTVTTVAGQCGTSGCADGTPAQTRLNTPVGMDFDRNTGTILVGGNGCLKVHRVNADGSSQFVSGDTYGHVSSIIANNPVSDYFIVMDTTSRKIWRVDANGDRTVFCGSGNAASNVNDAVGPCANVKYSDINTDGLFHPDGSFYYAERSLNAIYKIENGVSSLFAGGNGPSSTDGTRLTAQLGGVFGMGWSQDGKYMAFTSFTLHLIRRIEFPPWDLTPADVTCDGACMDQRCAGGALLTDTDGFATLLLKGTVAAQSGTVWGASYYTSDSHVAAAAMHAGVLAVGETKRVRIRCVGDKPSFAGSEKNSVTTQAWPTSWQAFYFVDDVSVPETTAPAVVAETCFHWFCAMSKCFTKGQVFDLVVTGQTSTAERSLWGHQIYSDDSDIRVAAVHSGVLAAGETATLTVMCHGPQEAYDAATRHQITSEAWGYWSNSWAVKKA